jgi:hypothetical protein
MMEKNLLEGKPLEFGNPDQIKLVQQGTDPEEVHPYDFRGGWRCIRCNHVNNYKSVYLVMEERWRTITPYVNVCQVCKQRLLLWIDDEDFRRWNFMQRFVGAYEDLDELKYVSEYDAWKYYLMYPQLRSHETVKRIFHI